MSRVRAGMLAVGLSVCVFAAAPLAVVSAEEEPGSGGVQAALAFCADSALLRPAVGCLAETAAPGPRQYLSIVAADQGIMAGSITLEGSLLGAIEGADVGIIVGRLALDDLRATGGSEDTPVVTMEPGSGGLPAPGSGPAPAR